MVGEQSRNHGDSAGRENSRIQSAHPQAGGKSWSDSTEPTADCAHVDPMTQEDLERTAAVARHQGRSIPQTFGEYVVLDQIGVGGMGRVFKARHKRLERIVAVKQLPVSVAESPQAVRRFQREVLALAKLEHPNIVMAHDAGEVNGLLFLVMQYVDGPDLKSLVHQNGPCPVSQAVDYVVQAARGLDFAHRQGIIHRDVKPSNLILDNHGTVKILDLGLARFQQALETGRESPTEALTFEGDQLGTVEYMAPEQAEDARQADQRSDIYSLGCTLYYLVMGQPPYTNEFPAAVLLAHCEAPIPALRVKRGDVPENLDVIFQKMLAKRPELRYQTMADVISALESTGIAGAPSLSSVVVPVSLGPNREKTQTDPSPVLLEIQHKGDTLIVTWATDIEGLDYQQIEAEMERVLDTLDETDAKNVIIDCRMTDYSISSALRYSSAALGLYVRLWTRVTSLEGRMALCAVSVPGANVLSKNKLDTLWPIYESLQEALEAIT